MSCKIIPFSELWFSAEFAYFSTDALSLRRSRSGTKLERLCVLVKDRRDLRVGQENANSLEAQFRKGFYFAFVAI